MCMNGSKTFLGIVAALLFAAGCSAEQEAQTPAESDPQTAGVAASDAPATAAGHSGVIEGIVRDANGEPVAGAFVKVKNEERRLTFLHISEEGGRYNAFKLPAGQYTVQAVGGDFESAWSTPVSIAQAGAGVMDVALDVERAPDLPPAWTRRTPEYLAMADSVPDGPAKDIIMARCTACHTEARVISRHVGAEDWLGIIDDMRLRAATVGLEPITEDEAAVVIDFLATNYPPLPAPDPNSRFPRELQAEDARNYRVVQYELENARAENHDIEVDPWGVGWANQRLGGKLGRFDPETYEFSEVEMPANETGIIRPGNPRITSEGIMWITEPFGNRWLSYDIAANEWTEYPFPSDELRGTSYGNTMLVHPDGTVWGSGPGAARRFNPATGEWDAWDTPSWNLTQMNPGGYGLAVAGDGRVWMAENQVDRIARIDPDSGEVVEFRIPGDETHYPRRMAHDPDGNVWAALWSSGKLLRIDYRTDEITMIEPPIPHNGAYALDFDESSGLMWTTLHTRDILASYEPDTGAWEMYPLPQAETDTRRVEVDQFRPNRVWWSTVAYQARIGFLEVLEE
jgi:streptogramin lyase